MFQNKKRRLYVITRIEFIEILILFSFILYFLFPKTLLKHVVVSEEKNYDLAFVYLENMVRLSPDNHFLTIELINVAIKLGKFNLAEKLLISLDKKRLIRKSHVKVLKLFYELEKQIFYYSYDVKKKNKAKKEMGYILKKIILNKFLDKDNYQKWYIESSLVEDKKIQLDIALYAYIKNRRSVYWIKQCYYLAGQLGYNRSVWLERLIKWDRKKSDYWINALVNFYIEKKKFIKAFDVVNKVLEKVSGQKKEKYFLKALDILQWGTKYKEVVNFTKKYEDYFIDSIIVSNKILTVYLNIGALKEADRFSRKLLKANYEN